MANRNKATHFGHCQVCERRQKLPNGMLAKHGYQVAGFGFFNGTCYGSENLPFEEDKSLVEDSIARAELYVVSLIKQAEQDRTRDDGYWVHEYSSSRFHSGYTWRFMKPDDIVIERGGRSIQWLKQDGHKGRNDFYPDWDKGENEWTPMRLANEQHAKSIEREIVEMRRYVARQQARLVDWKVVDCEPITK